MTNSSLQNVFSPLRIGPVEVKNRIFSSAHQTSLVRDHQPTPELLAYHRERARGGAGAIFLEATAVHPSGLLTPKTLAGYEPAIVDGLSEIRTEVHSHGTRLFVQLFHGGREQIASAPKAPAVAPSAVPTTRFHVEPRALTRAEIQEIIEGYAVAAEHMMMAGLDGIEVSSSHAYLPSQFFTRRSNFRTDEYGAEHPLRFLNEIMDAVRERVGDKIAVGCRLALDEMSQSGLSEPECLDFASAVSESLPVDFISFTLGDSATFSGGAFIAPRPRTMPESILARMPQKRQGGPVIMATTRVTDIHEAEAAIAAGLTDMVGMTRAQIADPHLVRKAQSGERSIPCIGCNVGCIGHYHAGLPIACVMNQATGRETSLPQPAFRPSSVAQGSKRQVAVLGAGVAGMAAAVELASAGQQVTVFEKESEIGGQLRLAGNAPDHQFTWETWRDWQYHLIESLPIKVQLESTIGERDLAEFDDVIDARGAKPYRDERFGGVNNVEIIDAWDFLQNPEHYAADNILISDWGGEPTGLDCVEVLLGRGHTVRYAFGGAMPATNIHYYQQFGYLKRIDVAECEVIPFTQVDAVDGSAVLRGSFSDRVSDLPAGTTKVIIAHGRVPAIDAAQTVGKRVGDVDGPRTLEEAALEGYRAARALSS